MVHITDSNIVQSVRGLEVSSQYNTAVYSATLDVDGQLIVAVADMDVFKEITPQFVCYQSGVFRQQLIAFVSID